MAIGVTPSARWSGLGRHLFRPAGSALPVVVSDEVATATTASTPKTARPSRAGGGGEVGRDVTAESFAVPREVATALHVEGEGGGCWGTMRPAAAHFFTRYETFPSRRMRMGSGERRTVERTAEALTSEEVIRGEKVFEVAGNVAGATAAALAPIRPDAGAIAEGVSAGFCGLAEIIPTNEDDFLGSGRFIFTASTRRWGVVAGRGCKARCGPGQRRARRGHAVTVATRRDQRAPSSARASQW